MPHPPLTARERAHQNWLCERATAETEPCEGVGGCGQPPGRTCLNREGEPLTHAPAHACRITRAARAAHTRTTPDPLEEGSP